MLIFWVVLFGRRNWQLCSLRWMSLASPFIHSSTNLRTWWTCVVRIPMLMALLLTSILIILQCWIRKMSQSECHPLSGSKTLFPVALLLVLRTDGFYVNFLFHPNDVKVIILTHFQCRFVADESLPQWLAVALSKQAIAIICLLWHDWIVAKRCKLYM